MSAVPPRIGVIGGDVPRQLVRACGGSPVRLLGSWAPPPGGRAAELLGAVDPVAVHVLDGLLGADADEFRGVVVCNDSLANLRLFYVLRVLAARGEVPFPVHLLDAPFSDPRFVAQQYRRLVGFLVDRLGAGLTVSALRAAGEQERSVGEELAMLRERRKEGWVTGSAVLAATLRAQRDEPVSGGDSADRPPEPNGRSLFVTGSGHPDTSFYELLEGSGHRIVGDDHDTGDDAWVGAHANGSSVPAVLEGLVALHTARIAPSARALARARAAALVRAVHASRAEAVVQLARTLDDAPAWDAVAQRSAVAPTPFAGRAPVAPDRLRAVAAEVTDELARVFEGAAA